MKRTTTPKEKLMDAINCSPNKDYQVVSDKHMEFLVIEAFKSTGYLIINKTLIKKFGLVTAVILSNFIDKYIYFKTHNPENDGWFYLTHESQMKQLGLGEHSIIKSKHELQKMGGIPNYEYYHINFSVLSTYFIESVKTIDPSLSGGLYPSLSGGLYNKEPKSKEPKSKEEDVPTISSKQSEIKEQEKEYLPLAKQLRRIVKTNRKIEIPLNQVISWTKPLRLLHTTEKIDYDRMQTGLDWYADHIGEYCVPEIYSGEAFKKKFLALEAAIERAKQDRKKIIPMNVTGSRQPGLVHKSFDKER
jgi:hypothetical protein